MPVPNEDLVEVDIPTLNNLFLKIGFATYEQILSKDGENRRKLHRGKDTTLFTAIVNRELLAI